MKLNSVSSGPGRENIKAKNIKHLHKLMCNFLLSPQCWVMLTPEPSMTSLGRKGWRWKAGRYVLCLTWAVCLKVEWICCYIIHTVLTYLHYQYLMVMMLCRWWRGRELQQKFEKSTKGCREKEKRGDCSKELTPRFSESPPHSFVNFTVFLVWASTFMQILLNNLCNTAQLWLWMVSTPLFIMSPTLFLAS